MVSLQRAVPRVPSLAVFSQCVARIKENASCCFGNSLFLAQFGLKSVKKFAWWRIGEKQRIRENRKKAENQRKIGESENHKKAKNNSK